MIDREEEQELLKLIDEYETKWRKAEAENAALKSQIEAMKNCENCDRINCWQCTRRDKWNLGENK